MRSLIAIPASLTLLHEPALREVWGGRLCLTRFDHTFRELQRTQRVLGDGGAERLGMQMLSSVSDVMDNQVDLGAVDASMQAALDKEYGPGLVHVDPALTPT